MLVLSHCACWVHSAKHLKLTCMGKMLMMLSRKLSRTTAYSNTPAPDPTCRPSTNHITRQQEMSHWSFYKAPSSLRVSTRAGRARLLMWPSVRLIKTSACTSSPNRAYLQPTQS